MNVVLIMAKDGSIGLPDKNIWKIKGRTLLGWVINDALESKHVDKVFVSTNGKAVASIAGECGAQVIMREDELAKNEKFLDAVDHSVKYIKDKYPTLQIIAIPQCVVPYRDPDIFERCIAFLIENPDYDSAVTIRRTGYIPEALMKKVGEQLIPYFADAQESASPSRQDSVAYEIDHAVECFRYSSWLNRSEGVKPWNYIGKKIKGIEQSYHNHNCFVDVHTLDDIRWLEMLVDELGFDGMRSETGHD